MTAHKHVATGTMLNRSKVSFAIAALVCCLFATTDAKGTQLPTDEEVNGILKACAVGRVQRYEGEVRGKIEFWKKGASGTGSASIEDLGALLSAIKPDPNSVKIYQTYVSCIKDIIGAYINNKQSNVDPDGYHVDRDGQRHCKVEYRDTTGMGTEGRQIIGTFCLMANGAWVQTSGPTILPAK